MRSKVIERTLKEMELDPWYVKLRRWFRLEIWVIVCKTRFIWDLTYHKNIFKKRKINN